MRYLLDTNVISELRKGERADAGLLGWLNGVEPDDLGISLLVLGELRLGALRIGRRDPEAAGHLSAWLTRLERAYEGRVLGIDRQVIDLWAAFNAERPLPVIDSLQAATAAAHGLAFVTRNLADLRGVPVELLDPFGG